MDYNEFFDEYGEYYDYLRKTLDKNIIDETIKNAINNNIDIEAKPPWFYFDRSAGAVYDTNDITANYAVNDSLSTSGNVVYEVKDGAKVFKAQEGKTKLRRCELLILKC